MRFSSSKHKRLRLQLLQIRMTEYAVTSSVSRAMQFAVEFTVGKSDDKKPAVITDSGFLFFRNSEVLAAGADNA
jgi:hypothetical protein